MGPASRRYLTNKMDAIIARIRALTDADFLDQPGIVGGDTPALRHWARTAIADNILVWRDRSAGSPHQGPTGPVSPDWAIQQRHIWDAQQRVLVSDGYRADFCHRDGEARLLRICLTVPGDGEVRLEAYALDTQPVQSGSIGSGNPC